MTAIETTILIDILSEILRVEGLPTEQQAYLTRRHCAESRRDAARLPFVLIRRCWANLDWQENLRRKNALQGLAARGYARLEGAYRGARRTHVALTTKGRAAAEQLAGIETLAAESVGRDD